MARYTSLQVGGPADALARPANREELRELLELCHAHATPVRVLGAGFNSIVPDVGFRGLILRLASLREIRTRDDGTLEAEAGASHTSLTRACAEGGLAGLEFAVGIPGTVGGWLAMNAGIGTREIKDVVTRIQFLERSGGAVHTMDAEQIRFRYRTLEVPAEVVLTAACFATRPEDPVAIRERMREHMEERRKTQPVDQRSCGSVFKNPRGDFAGRLIEAAGLRGARSGGAEISTVHANFIVNRGGATASDVLRLIDRARSEVARQFGVELEPEVRVLGAES